MIACGGEAIALTTGASATAPSIDVRQIVEATPKTLPWYAPSASWWIAVIITTSETPFATPNAARIDERESAVPDHANAIEEAAHRCEGDAQQARVDALDDAPVTASPTIIPPAIAASANPYPPAPRPRSTVNFGSVALTRPVASVATVTAADNNREGALLDDVAEPLQQARACSTCDSRVPRR